MIFLEREPGGAVNTVLRSAGSFCQLALTFSRRIADDLTVLGIVGSCRREMGLAVLTRRLPMGGIVNDIIQILNELVNLVTMGVGSQP